MENEQNNDLNKFESPSPAHKKSKFKEIIKEIAIFVFIVFGVVIPFRMYIAEPYLVDGRSMDPTFETGDYLIVDKLSYRRKSPERNSVVVFKYPNDPKKSFIKRIIGLPGETVVVKDNEVTIINSDNPNGFKLDQTYITHKGLGNVTENLGGDEYFVMGDNRAESFDSRAWGPLPRENILGKPLIKLWPVREIEFNPGSLD